MKPYFCTVFDGAYAAKGIAMLLSVVRRCSESPMIWICAGDPSVSKAVSRLGLSNHLFVVPVEELERNPVMAEAKRTRSKQEWFWTLGSAFSDWCMRTFRPPSLTYLDADMFLFHDPMLVLRSLADPAISVGVTPHNFPPERRHQLVNGRYCVSWVSWKRDGVGEFCLQEWSWRVKGWCKYEHSEGRFADQKYLDEWAERYKGVVDLVDPPTWAAPWNAYAHSVGPGPTIDGKPLIAYHAHELKRSRGRTEKRTGYPVSKEAAEFVYVPYEAAYDEAEKIVEAK